MMSSFPDELHSFAHSVSKQAFDKNLLKTYLSRREGLFDWVYLWVRRELKWQQPRPWRRQWCVAHVRANVCECVRVKRVCVRCVYRVASWSQKFVFAQVIEAFNLFAKHRIGQMGEDDSLFVFSFSQQLR